MSGRGDSFFDHVRTKLRHSRSTAMLTTSMHSQIDGTNWDNVHPAFRPVERADPRVVDGYHLNRPLPGPPPRPRSASPFPSVDTPSGLDFGRLKNPTPRTHRSRSAEIAQKRWSNTREMDDAVSRHKRAIVNIAVALPQDHVEPPPPYSKNPSNQGITYEPAPTSRPSSAHATYFVKPYDPNDYVRPQIQQVSRSIESVPIIAIPNPPTPVSPLNDTDFHYLAGGKRPVQSTNITIENLLTHPMLQHRRGSRPHPLPSEDIDPMT